MKRRVCTVFTSLVLACSVSLLGGCGGSNKIANSGTSGGTSEHSVENAGGQGKAGEHGTGNGALCADRTKGALVTLVAGGEPLTLWITNDAFIDEAKVLLENGGKSKNALIFEQVIDGQDCDPKWTFHVDPAQAKFGKAIELCDGRPSHLEGDTPKWIADVKRYCPWIDKISAVEDRRGR